MREHLNPRYWRYYTWRVLPILAYISLAAAAGYSLDRTQANLDRVEELRQQRVEDNAQADRRICHRQEEVTRRLIVTKGFIADSDTILRNLLVAVTTRPPRPEEELQRAAVNKAKDQLTRQIQTLEEGQEALGEELDSVDCENLPSARPFEE